MQRQLEKTELKAILRLGGLRGLDCSSLVIQALESEEEDLILTGLESAQNHEIRGLLPYLERHFQNGSENIARAVLSVIQKYPSLEYKNFLINRLNQGMCRGLEPEGFQALAVIYRRGDQESLEFLREKASSGVQADETSVAALEILFELSDLEYISILSSRLLNSATEDLRFQRMCQLFHNRGHSNAFRRLLRLYKDLSNRDSEIGADLICGLLGAYDQSLEFVQDYSQVKSVFLSFCASSEPAKASLCLRNAPFLNTRDSDFIFQVVQKLLGSKSSSPGIDRDRIHLAGRLGQGLGDLNDRRLVVQEIQKSMRINLQDLKERLFLRKERLARSDGLARNNILEFFESLGHEKLMLHFLDYIKNDGKDQKVRKDILSLLSQLKQSLSKVQVQRLDSVISFMEKEKPTRESSPLSAEFTNLDFCKAWERVLIRIDSLLDLCLDYGVFDEMCLVQIHQVLPEFENTQGLILKIIRLALHANGRSLVEFGFRQAFAQPVHIMESITRDFSPHELPQFDFLQEFFYKTGDSGLSKIGAILSWQESNQIEENSHWAALWLGVLQGSCGEIPRGFSDRVLPLVYRFSWNTLEEFILSDIPKKNYCLKSVEVGLLLELIKAHGKVKSPRFKLKRMEELIYQCIRDENFLFHPELAQGLIQLEDDYGKILLLQCLGSDEVEVLKKTITICMNLKIGSKWKKVFQLMFHEDASLSSLAVDFFGLDYPEFSLSELLEHLGGFLPEEVALESPGQGESLKKIERDLLDRILLEMGHTRNSPTTTEKIHEEKAVWTVFSLEHLGMWQQTMLAGVGERADLAVDLPPILNSALHKYHGSLNRIDGNRHLFLFKNPLDGLLFALESKKRLKAFNQGREDTQKIHFRAALISGEVLIRSGELCGERIDLLERMERMAGFDSILCHENSLNNLQGFFNLKPMEGIHVKGMQEAQNLFVLKGVRREVLDAYVESETRL